MGDLKYRGHTLFTVLSAGYRGTLSRFWQLGYQVFRRSRKNFSQGDVLFGHGINRIVEFLNPFPSYGAVDRIPDLQKEPDSGILGAD